MTPEVPTRFAGRSRAVAPDAHQSGKQRLEIHRPWRCPHGRFSRASITDHGVTLRFAVTDTGIGIAQDHNRCCLARLRNWMVRRHAESSGTGLGLVLCKRLAEMMGGQIGIQSEPGRGSTFWFTAVFERQPRSAELEDALVSNLGNTRILVADGHAPSRLCATQLLHRLNCRWAEAVDGPSALHLLSHAEAHGDPFQVALIDAALPQIDETEWRRTIKSEPERAGLRLVLMSPLGRPTSDLLRGHLDFCASITKPMRKSRLRDCLARLVAAPPGRSRRCPGPPV